MVKLKAEQSPVGAQNLNIFLLITSALTAIGVFVCCIVLLYLVAYKLVPNSRLAKELRILDVLLFKKILNIFVNHKGERKQLLKSKCRMEMRYNSIQGAVEYSVIVEA
ncbi:unnamed protein product [Allacma fusca]|uniref:Uncharacterized protein n=1 Tax=Allacma fusca TaxID=39272 RepID=A0A8J2NFV8_9HEXA|nr:unnamed protein product [Allacma fusca]